MGSTVVANVGDGPAAPAVAFPVTGPRPVRKIWTVSPAFAGLAADTTVKSVCSMAPLPIPPVGMVKIPGEDGPLYTGTSLDLVPLLVREKVSVLPSEGAV